MFSYTDGRKDDLWFNRSDIRVHFACDNGYTYLQQVELRNPNLPSGYKVQPINRKVLNKITIKTNNGTARNEIDFDTDYLLRPSSFYSYTIGKSFTHSRGWVTEPVVNSSNGAVLTLTGLSVKSAGGNTIPPVKFYYTTPNPAGWDSLNIGRDPAYSAGWVPYYISEQDYWGYYSAQPCVNPGDWSQNSNNFNRDGLEAKVSAVDAWSLSKVEMPNGMSIEWEYEPHRYDSTNKVASRMVNSTPVAKFGGGIRTKKMTVGNGVDGNDLTRRYFYTEQDGIFVENRVNGNVTNSSGHATVEPLQYLDLNAHDTRPQLARGGEYTAAKVQYQKVQVVDNYIEPDVTHTNGQTPNGFTVYEFVTAKDSPNDGRYGDYDNDWKRGMLKAVKVYDKNSRLLSKDTTLFEVKEAKQILGATTETTQFIKFPWYSLNNVRIKETVNVTQGVATRKLYGYASSINDKDSVLSQNCQILPNYTQRKLYLDENSYLGSPGAQVLCPARAEVVFEKKYGDQTR